MVIIVSITSLISYKRVSTVENVIFLMRKLMNLDFSWNFENIAFVFSYQRASMGPSCECFV